MNLASFQPWTLRRIVDSGCLVSERPIQRMIRDRSRRVAAADRYRVSSLRLDLSTDSGLCSDRIAHGTFVHRTVRTIARLEAAALCREALDAHLSTVNRWK